ncbi:MAG: CbiQ family ECF transporter T component, partial [Candidatus Omnitrophota bacterium]|nr:CbiQ family ECF transporter T component [Candidatus Omnitrophota bacterium]
MHDFFSEQFARKDNFLSKADARIKMIFVAAAIVTVISSAIFYVGLIVILLVIASLFSIRISFKAIAIRLAAPLGIAGTLLFIKVILCHDSLNSGMLFVSKIIGSTSLVLFLGLTTPLDNLLAACHWFKVPKTWIEICLIAYRYIFVLLEDAITVF